MLRVARRHLASWIEAENAAVDRLLPRRFRAAFEERVLQRTPHGAGQVCPERSGDFFYWEEDQWQIWRRPLIAGPEEGAAAPELVLDPTEVARAEGLDYVRLGGLALSPDHRLLAFTLDRGSGQELFHLHLRDLDTGLSFSLPRDLSVTSMTWGGGVDPYVLYAVGVDTAEAQTGSEQLRSDSLLRWIVARSNDGLLQLSEVEVVAREETAREFFLDVRRTKDDRFVLLNLNSLSSSEVRALEASALDATPRVLVPQAQGRETFVDHGGGQFFLLERSVEEEGMRLMSVGTEALWEPGGPPQQKPVVLSESTVSDLELFRDFVVTFEPGQVRVTSRRTGDAHMVPLPSPSHVIQPGTNDHYGSDTLRFTLSSVLDPCLTFDYHMSDRVLREVNALAVPGLPRFEARDYTISRLQAPSADGTGVPLTVAHRKDLALDGSHPALLHSYGAYGAALDTSFNPQLVPLLEHGWVVAFAHIRGGGDLGRQWYQEGRRRKKHKSFQDLEACAATLVGTGYTTPSRLAAWSSSAGGLVLAVLANSRPDLFRAMVMRVPFLDVLGAMLDPASPLTAHEYDEWGNPLAELEDLDYIRRYAPLENIQRQPYPWMLVSSQLDDARVSAEDAARWVAATREANTGSSEILLRIQAGGHFDCGDSPAEQAALEHAFLYRALELQQPPPLSVK